MKADTSHRDAGLLLLALLATTFFALDAVGRGGSTSQLAGILATSLLPQRYWKRERNRMGRQAPTAMSHWIGFACIAGVATCFGLMKWMVPVLSISAVLATVSALDAASQLRRIAAKRGTPGSRARDVPATPSSLLVG